MSTQQPLFNPRRVSLLLALVVLLASVYMLTYSGRIESGDSLMVVDAVGSLVKFGDTRLDLSLWYNPPSVTMLRQSGPMNELEVESFKPNLQVVLAAPLYWLADRLPGIGLVHTVWLFNVLVTAAAGGLLFLYALALGYSETTSIGAALVFGLGTIVFPYSKTFFRDPLTMFMVLLAAFLIERLRAKRYRSPLLWLGAALALYGILLTKTTAAFAFPALLVAAFPALDFISRRGWLRVGLHGLLLTILVVPVILVFSGLLNAAPDYQFVPFGLWSVSPFFMQTALHSYLFSIGGSVWGTSPVLLLSVPGLWWLYRRTQNRYVWVVVLMTLGYAVGYAVIANRHWFGGLSWPPRFLLPVVPFLVIGALPVLDNAIRKQSQRAILAVTAATACSLWIQWCAVSLEYGKYADALPPEANRLIEWGGGLNVVQYLRWVVIPGLWSREPLDFIWIRVEVAGWVLSFTALAAVCGLILWRLLRNKSGRWLWATGTLPPAAMLLAFIGLHGIVNDPVYLGSDSSLNALHSILETETGAGDVILLSSNTYERFFLNHARLDARVITLPFQPGERPGETQAAQVVSDNTDLLLTDVTAPLIYLLARDHARLWLVEDAGPFIAWKVRPVERFLAAHYYPIREIQTSPPDPALRLLEYSMVNAPDPYAFRGAEQLTDLSYGEAIQLTGYTLPWGSVYAPGDILPVSLYWQTNVPLTGDYTVAWFLADAATDTVVAQGMDSPPGGGFARTTTWQPGIPVWDNRAMRLPATLSPGAYRLWVSVYEYTADGLRRLAVTGDTTVQEGTVGVLPTLIEIR